MILPGIVQFRKCTLSDKELAEVVALGLVKLYTPPFNVPVRNIPARPNEDFDLIVGEMCLRLTESKWIPVKDKKPQDSKEVLVFAPNRTIIGSKLIGCYFTDGDSWSVYDFGGTQMDELVTHWMPLPENPY